MNKKGFTLIELMVVVLIVAILAAVGIPLMQGRIDAAKWSEGKAGAGTIHTAIRAWLAEKGNKEGSYTVALTAATGDTLGFATSDLEGTYFGTGDYPASIAIEVDGAGLASYDILVTPGKSGKADPPTTPEDRTLSVAGNVATWN